MGSKRKELTPRLRDRKSTYRRYALETVTFPVYGIDATWKTALTVPFLSFEPVGKGLGRKKYMRFYPNYTLTCIYGLQADDLSAFLELTVAPGEAPL